MVKCDIVLIIAPGIRAAAANYSCYFETHHTVRVSFNNGREEEGRRRRRRRSEIDL